VANFGAAATAASSPELAQLANFRAKFWPKSGSPAGRIGSDFEPMAVSSRESIGGQHARQDPHHKGAQRGTKEDLERDSERGHICKSAALSAS